MNIEKEEIFSKQRALQLYENTLKINQINGKTIELIQIHRYLFMDVFSFAGKIRSVDLSKGNFKFAPVKFLNESLRIIDNMPIDSYEKIIKKYIEMNIAHPFREGNGRAMRIWLDFMLREKLNVIVRWDKIPKNEYLNAMIISPINEKEIMNLIKNALTSEINNNAIYKKVINASFNYEGMTNYII